MNKKILCSVMIMAIIFVINGIFNFIFFSIIKILNFILISIIGKYASANTVHLKDLTSYLITPKPWPKGCWICPICGLCCNCEESKPETDSVSSCYVGDEQIEKQEVITKCAEHTDEFGTGPYMCGVRKL